MLGGYGHVQSVFLLLLSLVEFSCLLMVRSLFISFSLSLSLHHFFFHSGVLPRLSGGEEDAPPPAVAVVGFESALPAPAAAFAKDR